MRVISNTVVLFVIIYCADEIRGKKRNRNNENEILKKTEIMLTKNQRLNVGIFGPIKRNMVQVEPVLGKKYCLLLYLLVLPENHYFLEVLKMCIWVCKIMIFW